MRTRSRYTLNALHPAVPAGALTGCRLVQCNGTVTTFNDSTAGYAAFPKDFEDERITDDVGRDRVNPVVHKSRRRVIYPLTGVATPADSPYGDVTYGDGNDGELSHYTIGRVNGYFPSFDPNSNNTLPDGWSLVLPTTDERVIINDIYQKGSQPKADVLLNIVEANQAIPSLQSVAAYLPLMKQNWRKLRTMIATSSSSYLAWKFGIGPIISDLSNIAKFGPDMNRQFKLYTEGKRIRVSRLLPVSMTYSKAPVVIATKNAVSAWGASYQGFVTGRPSLRYVMVLEPTQSYRTPVFQKLDFLLKRFTTSPASLAWEVIPFSFVADWFLDVRSVLKEVDTMLGFNPYRVMSLTKSISYAVTSQMFLQGWRSCASHGLLFDRLAAEEEIRSYERSLPTSGGIIPTLNGRYGKNQAALTAALIAQSLFKAHSARLVLK